MACRQAITWFKAGILLIGPLGPRLQWNFNQNSYILIKEIAFQNAVGEAAAILSQPQCVNSSPPSAAYMRQ